MFGLLPPSSRVTRLNVPAAFFMMIRPTSVDPVNATLSTPGCLTRASPAVSPKPGTMLMTPAGKPASMANSPMRRQLRGVCSAGFMTMVQPAASAGPHFHETMSIGKFHGMICPTTPTGSRRV